MVSKIAFLVLLGAALVVANPTPKVENTELLERSIEDAWNRLGDKFSKAIDQMSEAWETVKKNGEDLINTNFEPIKEKGLKLMEDAKDLYKQLVIDGKHVLPKLNNIADSLTNLVGNLKVTGSEAVVEAKALAQEVVDAVVEKIKSIAD